MRELDIAGTEVATALGFSPQYTQTQVKVLCRGGEEDAGQVVMILEAEDSAKKAAACAAKGSTRERRSDQATTAKGTGQADDPAQSPSSVDPRLGSRPAPTNWVVGTPSIPRISEDPDIRIFLPGVRNNDRHRSSEEVLPLQLSGFSHKRSPVLPGDLLGALANTREDIAGRRQYL
jgi:hypothetical protein